MLMSVGDVAIINNPIYEYIGPDLKTEIENYLTANLDYAGVVHFDYLNQPELQPWMNQRMDGSAPGRHHRAGLRGGGLRDQSGQPVCPNNG